MKHKRCSIQKGHLLYLIQDHAAKKDHFAIQSSVKTRNHQAQRQIINLNIQIVCHLYAPKFKYRYITR
jgi:hypothetical protein